MTTDREFKSWSDSVITMSVPKSFPTSFRPFHFFDLEWYDDDDTRQKRSTTTETTNNDYRSKFTGQASVILAVQIIRISLRVVATSTLNYLAAKIP